MEKVYTGSRMADGNKISPPEISFKHGCVVIKEAGINGKLITVSCDDIVQIDTKTPLIGFSSITLGYVLAHVVEKSTFSKKEKTNETGTSELHGFSKSEVKEIKTLIEMGGLGTDDDDINEDVEDNESASPELSGPSSASTPEAQPERTSTNKSSLEGLYDERLEKLINAALADGELTEKEKKILFKNAEAQGIDLDEFEMVLEARLHERKAK